MPFESKYLNKKQTNQNIGAITNTPQKVKAIVHVDNGKVEVSFKPVPKFGLKIDEIDGQPIMGTELFFEGRLFYPVVWAHKSEVGWNVTKPDFLIQEELFFFNPSLKREETELDLQGFFKTIDPANWKRYIEELNNQGFEAVKIALNNYIKESKK
jgi:hypothetical protein